MNMAEAYDATLKDACTYETSVALAAAVERSLWFLSVTAPDEYERLLDGLFAAAYAHRPPRDVAPATQDMPTVIRLADGEIL